MFHDSKNIKKSIFQVTNVCCETPNCKNTSLQGCQAAKIPHYNTARCLYVSYQGTWWLGIMVPRCKTPSRARPSGLNGWVFPP